METAVQPSDPWSTSESTAMEDVEDEPRLKYHRLGASCAELLKVSAASCLRVEDKMLALGTQQGAVHVLDFDGNEIRRFDSHTATVNELSFDTKSEYIASCSDDGAVVVHSLYSEELTRLQYNRPIKTVALDPNYGSRSDRQIACAGLAGLLTLNSRSWLGPRDSVLHKGEGPIPRLRWSGQLIAWANDKGVKIYDTVVHQRIGFIERPRGASASDAHHCSFFWEAGSLLYIGWGSNVQIAKIVQADQPHGGSGPGQSVVGQVPKLLPGSSGPQRYVEIVAFFQTSYIVAGIAPFGRDLAILAFLQDTSEDRELATAGSAATRPELRIVTWDNQEVASDALSLHGYEHLKASDYSLAAFHPMVCRAKDPPHRSGPRAEPSTATVAPTGNQVTKWWRDGYEPLYYVVSPKDIVLGRPRDGEDRVAWMIQHKRFEDALVLVEKGEASKLTTRDAVTQAYLEHLLAVSEFEKAASLCPRLLQGNAAAWERWVYMFAQLRQLPTLAWYIPVEEPRLRGMAYEVVLSSFLTNASDHDNLLAIIKTWPSTGLYSPETICEKARARINKYGGSPALKEVVAELLKTQGKYDEALNLYLAMGRKDVFEFVEHYNLLSYVSQHVIRLMRIDEERTLGLLVDCWEVVSPDVVVKALISAERKSAKGDQAALDWRKLLHMYLHLLFLRDPEGGAAHHGLQVELYAEFDPQSLMYFLTHSQQYPLEEAYEVCKARGLVREMVFILGRMGNAPQALFLIIDALNDIPQAIEFVNDQRDDELWDVLITHAISSPDLTAALLNDIGSYCNPLRLLQRIPAGLEIPCLRDRLVKIISDFRTQTSLREGCNRILQADCVSLAQKLYREVRSAVKEVYCIEPTSQQWQRINNNCSDRPISSCAAVPETVKAAFALRSTKGKQKLPTDPQDEQQDTVVIRQVWKAKAEGGQHHSQRSGHVSDGATGLRHLV